MTGLSRVALCRSLRAPLTALLVLVGSTGVMAADCAPLAKLRAEAGRLDPVALEQARAAVKSEPTCRGSDGDAADRIFGNTLAALAESVKDPAEARALLAKAAEGGKSWRALLALGNRLHAEGKDAEASRLLQEAIETIDSNRHNELLAKAPANEAPPSEAVIKDIYALANQYAHVVAAAKAPVAVKAPTNRRAGGTGGVFNREIMHIVSRSADAVRIPMPIIFNFDSTEMTPVGREHAELLAAVLKERRVTALTVVGHTDQSGGADYNRKLSIRRAEAIKAFLLEKTAMDAKAITVIGRGKDEPRTIVRPEEFSADQIAELNRRVEFTWVDPD